MSKPAEPVGTLFEEDTPTRHDLCAHCGAGTVYAMGGAFICWPPCAHLVAYLRVALSDPETAEGAAMLLCLAGVEPATLH